MNPTQSILHLPSLLQQVAEPIQITVEPYTLHFRRPAQTSRGIYREKQVYYLRIQSRQHPHHVGVGESAPMPQLSCDDTPEYATLLQSILQQVAEGPKHFDAESLRPYPSIAFGVATALSSFLATCKKEGKEGGALCSTPFTRGEKSITINGLIWMGDKHYMYEQICTKLEQGFKCLKLKIGGIDFEEELALLRYIRQHFSPEEVELRVDANGAFAPSSALQKLQQLSQFQIHSIEQPTPACSNGWQALSKLTSASPLPIALDEELIGIHTRIEKAQLLDEADPHFIILKPSLHSGVDEWIELAEERGIGWWATSALESNIGLNAIAQWVSQYDPQIPQGLGTGALYLNNLPSPLHLHADQLNYQ